MTAFAFYLLAGLAILAVMFLMMIAAHLTRLEKSITELTKAVEARVREMYQTPEPLEAPKSAYKTERKSGDAAEIVR